MKEKSRKVPEAMAEKVKEILALTDSFCRERLSEESRDLARDLVSALARKRPSPLASGRAASLGAGAVHALCFVNFLFDPSQKPSTTVEAIADHFGVSKSTVSGVSKKIRDAMKMSYFSTDWCLPSRIGDNPFAWWVEVNGFMVDARTLPLHLQTIAFEKGLIPYVPGEGKARS
jgi:hypothetical protein